MDLHFATMWGQIGSVDGEEFAQAAERERATVLISVGDAMAKPLLRASDEAKARGGPIGLRSVKIAQFSHAKWTAPVALGLFEHMPDAKLVDGMGATARTMSIPRSRQGGATDTAQSVLVPTTGVPNEDGREFQSGEVGPLAVLEPQPPLGYYKDPDVTARTFRILNRQRYTVPTERARVDESGRVTLLGRGSGCINTGGEKEAVKATLGLEDCLVVALPNERFGESVAADFPPTGPVSEDPGRDLVSRDAGGIQGTPTRSCSSTRSPGSRTGSPTTPPHAGWPRRTADSPSQRLDEIRDLACEPRGLRLPCRSVHFRPRQSIDCGLDAFHANVYVRFGCGRAVTHIIESC